MTNDRRIIIPLGETEEDKKLKLREEEANKALRDTLRSIKRDEWILTDYELALTLLELDFKIIGDALYRFYWESSRTRNEAEKTLNIIKDVIKKEVLMEKLAEKP